MPIKLSSKSLRAIEMAYRVVKLEQSLVIAKNLEKDYLDQVPGDEFDVVEDRIDGIYRKFAK